MLSDGTNETCVICGAENLVPWGRVSDYEYGIAGSWGYVRCEDCSGIQMYPMAQENDLTGFYPATYGAYQQGSSILNSLISIYSYRQTKRLLSLLPDGAERILDIGCGDGTALVKFAKHSSLELWGVEINPGAAEAAKARGFHVQCGTLKDTDLPASGFDLIRLGHVLEHFPTPKQELCQILKLLKPGGLIYGETPNTACVDFKILGKYWGAFHAPRHVTLFNRSNLVQCLETAGFDTIKVTACIPPVGWCVGVQNLIRDQLELQAPSTGRYSWYPLLLPLFAGISWLQSINGRTGIIAFQARKPNG